MGLFQKKSAFERELDRLERQEARFLSARAAKQETYLNRLLEEKVPKKVQGTLNVAFSKAFSLIFEKGTTVIEKTYKREEIEKNFLVNEYSAELRNDRKALRAFSKAAGKTGTKNLILSGAAGMGMGLLGIGIPDIPLFTGLMLKNIYEIAMNFGYEYASEKERYFILLLIQGAVSYGEKMLQIDAEVNSYIDTGVYPADYDKEQMIDAAASCLSKELLYMKFLQGIPVVGVVGGAYDVVYIRRITEYAELKYRRRFYKDKKTVIG